MARLRPDGYLEAVPHMTRRTILGSAAGGFALATLPVSAETITTGTEGLVALDVKVPVQGGEAPAYFVRPEGDGPFPALLLISEIFGLHEHIRDVARRFAKEGFATLAQDYFFRAGDPSQIEDIDAIRTIVATAGVDQVIADTAAGKSFLDSEPTADTKRLGITGFCWGGAVVWLYAAHEPSLRAGVSWYGRLQPRIDGQPGPIDFADDLKAPVLGLYAEKDGGIPMQDVEAMRAAMAEAGNPTGSQIIVYPGVGHAFHADYRASYDQGAAKDGWKKCLDWLRINGVK